MLSTANCYYCVFVNVPLRMYWAMLNYICVTHIQSSDILVKVTVDLYVQFCAFLSQF